MANKGWKQFERKIATRLGTTRIPVTGVDRHGADLEQPMFCYQAKLRKIVPAFIYEWLGGICASAATKGKIGVLVLSRPRRPLNDSLVIVRFSDWVELHGAIETPPGPNARLRAIAQKTQFGSGTPSPSAERAPATGRSK